MKKHKNFLPSWQKINYNVRVSSLLMTIDKILSEKLEKSKYINRPIPVRVLKNKIKPIKNKVLNNVPELTSDEFVILDDEEFTDLVDNLENI